MTADRAISTHPRTFAVVFGLVLGWAAFEATQVGGAGAELLVVLVSSGFSWGLAGLVAGYTTPSAKHAALAGAGLLVVATVLYYVLILFVSRRWDLGTSADGGSPAAIGLRSVAWAAAFWLLGAVCGGAILGWLGHVIRHGSTRLGAIAAGLSLGLLAGDSAYQMGFGSGQGWPLLGVCLAVVASAVMFGFRSGRRTWWIFIGTGLVAIGISVLVWIPVEHIRTYGL